jgi:hypothetical protein
VNYFKTSVYLLAFPVVLLQAAPSQILTLFIEPYPSAVEFTRQEKLTTNIFFTYYGNSSISDSNGQVVFPVKTPDAKFFILVSNNIQPIPMIFCTINHLEIEEGALYTFFSVQRMYDQETHMHFWSVEQLKIPENLIIPINTIIVHADPQTIYIPTGITPTSNSPQLLLPTIYRKSKETKIMDLTVHSIHTKNGLQFLELTQYFSPIKRNSQISGSSESTKL